jgi:hypothetical protein
MANAHDDKLDLDTLKALAAASNAVARPCACAIDSYREWTRMPVEFPEQQMRPVGTLVDDPYQEASFEEYHPAGTGYWSADAPIAPRYFPYNRCSVLQCTVCGRCCLHYVEAGGYYVEKRIRALIPELIVDAPLK